VGINNRTNAALLAAQMLGSTSPITQAGVSIYAKTEGMAKIKRLEKIGWEDYELIK